jgi:lipoprotein signal peptidase
MTDTHHTADESYLFSILISLFLLVLIAGPLLGADLYTKYLAHTELTSEGQEYVITKHLSAIKPLRNYGTWWSGELDKDKAQNFTHLLILLLIVPAAFLWSLSTEFKLENLLLKVQFAGVLGNATELILFDGVTDFLTTNDTGLFLDDYVFNLADVFIFLPFLYFISAYILLSAWCALPDSITMWNVHTKIPPKYSEELTEEIVQRFTSGEPIDEIAAAFDKTANSVRGKLVSLGIYSQYKDINLRLSQMSNAQMPTITVEQGVECGFSSLIQYLNDAGYFRVGQVTEEGCFSVRGGIIRVRPFNAKNTVILDFYGDTVDAIKVVNQKTPLSSVTIQPYQLEAA